MRERERENLDSAGGFPPHSLQFSSVNSGNKARDVLLETVFDKREFRIVVSSCVLRRNRVQETHFLEDR